MSNHHNKKRVTESLMAFLNFGGSLRDKEQTVVKSARAARLGLKFCALIVAGSLIAGCATTSTNQDPQDAAAVAEYEQVNDPLEPMNRVFF